jgi:IS5 family transposase
MRRLCPRRVNATVTGKNRRSRTGAFRDARWTVKFTKAKPRDDGSLPRDLAIPAFGYKNHVSTDRRHGLIRKWMVTSASAHDGARLADLLDSNNTASDVWADTAYRSKKNEAHMEKHGFVSQVHRKKPKGKPMSERTSKANGRKSKVRAKVEHVFATQKRVRPVNPPLIFGLMVSRFDRCSSTVAVRRCG